MQYTENYHLPQWVKEDRIMMDDFNQMNNSIENGLIQVMAKADSANAKSDTAVQTANAASAKADILPYAVGSYVGNGGTQSINLGFRPSFLIISGMYDTAAGNSTEDWDRYFGMTGGHAINHRVSLTDTGFTVYVKDLTHLYYPDFSVNGRRYDYIAFK